LRLNELGERGFLTELESRGLAVAIGDDTAALEHGQVATVDTLVEDTHFRLSWTTWQDLGYKAAAVNLSDLAAAAARPEALLVGLGLPGDTTVAAALEFYEGLNEHGVPVRGGDTVETPLAVITVAALGRSRRIPGRAGARPGDAIVVTGPLGASAAGLHALECGLSDADAVVAAHLRPPVRIAEGLRLGEVATAVVDLSDGIGVDAGHIAAQSGCCLEIALEQLPLAPGVDRTGEKLYWAMGEDYELLATVPFAAASELGYPIIGRCREGSGAVITRAGAPIDLPGYEHFSARQADS
jgi:thiamine-monophosphate kinase